MRLLIGILLFCLAIFSTNGVFAQSGGSVIDIPHNEVMYPDAAIPVIGQVILAPNFHRWDRVELVMKPFGVGSQARAVIYEWDNTLKRVNGPALWEGPVMNYSADPDDGIKYYNLDLDIDPGSYYLIAFEVLQGEGLVSVWYGDWYSHGNLFQGSSISDLVEVPDYDMRLKAYFSNTPAIPTLSEWAIILFGGLVALVGAGLVWRSRPLGQRA